ncbi:MAG: HAD family hydrolase [Schwartzia sp.]|jgi:phosphoglycolate phosphatase|uniref:HAD family hydrolase n=1 Tax=Schwartzia succinivorans TaxID=55507 RepID=UPI002354C4B9|nr:HAD family hydrolase [Schwartzia succinivorans]MBQ3863208.1 HAD family hydrolase [Schwartzia sp. (in: firmicutes)]MBE6097883.1 HAD family hydrolase [Schwartzia succinivorans]MBQ4152118.1 HAD family hydrolase [Schwartzia sp. (in: firmicutes)]MBQ5413231.1 HAD family hydrolase [Schwartzia sp. (in: firmicutes)]MCR5446973.1 HAD family hydrolase [Schwartzia sp. (in: firmicutes)]
MTYKAAVFDLDGTLINSLSDLTDSGNEVLEKYGRPKETEDAFRYFVGNGSKKLIERILPDLDNDGIEKALAEYKEIYAKRLLNKTKPYDGITEMLEELKKRGIKIGVCTNKHMSAAEKILGKLFSEGTFDAYVGGRQGVPHKPDPANVFYVLEKLGVKPEETVYLGDTSVDMETAHNTGALAVGVTWGFRPEKELIESGAEILISHPMELFEKVRF